HRRRARHRGHPSANRADRSHRRNAGRRYQARPEMSQAEDDFRSHGAITSGPILRVRKMGAKEAPMAVVVVVRARLKAAPEQIQKLHDEVTAATKDAAVAAGDLSHAVYLDPREPRNFLGIDTWKSADAFQQFASNPKIQGFFAQMFEGAPDVTVFEDS